MQLAKLLETHFPAVLRRNGLRIFESADIILGGFDGQKVNISIDSDNDSELLMIRRLQNRQIYTCLLYTSPSPRDATLSRMPSSA